VDGLRKNTSNFWAKQTPALRYWNDIVYFPLSWEIWSSRCSESENYCRLQRDAVWTNINLPSFLGDITPVSFLRSGSC